MFCTKCGKKIPDNTKFCIYCGAPVDAESSAEEKIPQSQPQYDSTPECSRNKQKKDGGGIKAVIIAMIAVIVLLLCYIVGISIYNIRSKKAVDKAGNTVKQEEAITKDHSEDKKKVLEESSAEASSSQTAEAYSSEAEKTVPEVTAEQDTGSLNEPAAGGANSNDDFHISSSTAADYSSVMNFDKFEYYASDIDGFSFYYPVNLYNNVLKDTSISDSVYGKNVEDVSFTGSDGSSLEFIATERIDDASLSDATDYVYSEEAGSLDNKADIVPERIKDDGGFFIVTGNNKENAAVLEYLMMRVTDRYVMQMRVAFPDFTDDDDKNAKSFYTECLYRSCGFSNSSKNVRSYEDYLRGEN